MSTIHVSLRHVHPPHEYVAINGLWLNEVTRVALAPDVERHLEDVGVRLDDYCTSTAEGPELNVLRYAVAQARSRIERSPEALEVVMGTRYELGRTVNRAGNPVTWYEFIPAVGVLYVEGRPRVGGGPVVRELPRDECLDFLERLAELVEIAIEHGYAVEFSGCG